MRENLWLKLFKESSKCLLFNFELWDNSWLLWWPYWDFSNSNHPTLAQSNAFERFDLVSGSQIRTLLSPIRTGYELGSKREMYEKHLLQKVKKPLSLHSWRRFKPFRSIALKREEMMKSHRGRSVMAGTRCDRERSAASGTGTTAPSISSYSCDPTSPISSAR